MTPSKRRRMGRKAFVPYENPEDHTPYKKDAWGYDIYMADFLEGWKEAEDAWYAEEKEEICPECGQKIAR
jgi:hypothetical protein